MADGCEFDLEVTRGRALVDYMDLADFDTGDPIDLAGYTLAQQVRTGPPSAAGGTVVFTLTGGDGLAAVVPPGGTVASRLARTVSAARTLLLAAGGEYWTDLKLTPPGGGDPEAWPDTGPARVTVHERVTQ